MTDLTLSCDEPELPELSHLRELSRLETAPVRTREAVLARVRATQLNGAGRPGVSTRQRSMLLAALVLIGVPSAFAATPFGARQLGAWFEPHESPAPAKSATPRAPSKIHLQPQPAPPVQGAQGASPVEPGQTPTRSFAPTERPISAQRHLEPPAVEDAPPLPAEFAPSVRAFPPANDAASAAAPDTSQTATTLDAESQLLRQARLRLAVRDADGALRLAEEHRRRFPNGVLQQERNSIEQQAWALRSKVGWP